MIALTRPRLASVAGSQPISLPPCSARPVSDDVNARRLVRGWEVRYRPGDIQAKGRVNRSAGGCDVQRTLSNAPPSDAAIRPRGFVTTVEPLESNSQCGRSATCEVEVPAAASAGNVEYEKPEVRLIVVRRVRLETGCSANGHCGSQHSGQSAGQANGRARSRNRRGTRGARRALLRRTR